MNENTTVPELRSRIRDAFISVETGQSPHAGLLLDRGLYTPDTQRGNRDEPAKTRLLRRVCNQPAGELYALLFERWRHTIAEGRTVQLQEMTVQGRMAVGLGKESVLETGITLQHASGVPYLPGSAIKGMTRHFLLADLAADRQDSRAPEEAWLSVIFGTQQSAAYCRFYDAWYVPGSAPEDRPLALDVLTVHHPRYYNQPEGRRRPPWDFDDPNPVQFVSARGRYLVAVEGPDAAWTQAALAIVARALREAGAGAKTSTGYGRFQPTSGTASNTPQAQNDGADTAASPAASIGSAPPRPQEEPLPHPLLSAIDRLRHDKIKPEIAPYVAKWRLLEDGRDRILVGQALVHKAESTRDRRWLEHKAGPWIEEIRTYLRAQGETE